MTATARAVAEQYPDATPLRHVRVPLQVELGERLESYDLARMDGILASWQRAQRAPLTWSAIALLRALLARANWRNRKVYRKGKTLAHDAGLVPEPEPGKKRRQSRSFYYALKELVAFGAIGHERIFPRDPRLDPCPHRARSRCGCPYNRGQTVLTVLVATGNALRELAAAQISRAGTVLVRPPRARDRSAPNAPICTESRCTSVEGVPRESRCISLSVSTTLARKKPPSPLGDPWGARRSVEYPPADARPVRDAASPLARTPLPAPNNPPTDTPREEDAPSARLDVTPASPANAQGGFAPGERFGESESTDETGARGVPRRPLAREVSAVLEAHRRAVYGDAAAETAPAPAPGELQAIYARLVTHTVAELEEASRQAARSPYNAAPGRRTAGFVFGSDRVTDALIANYRHERALRERATARRRERELLAVPIRPIAAVIREQRATPIDPRRLELQTAWIFAEPDEKARVAREFEGLFGEPIAGAS